MADTAAHLIDRVLPEVPVRQWVLTLPYPLRYRCAWNARLTTEVLRAFRQARPHVEQMTEGERLGGVLRHVAEMVLSDQSNVITEHLQKQVDLLLAMPERQKAPRPKKRPWRVWECGKPRDNTWSEDEPPRWRGQFMAADNALQHSVAMEEVPFDGQGEDESLPCRNRVFQCLAGSARRLRSQRNP